MKISLTFLFFSLSGSLCYVTRLELARPSASPTSPAPRPPRQDYSTPPPLRGQETGSWTPAHHARSVRERTGSGHGTRPRGWTGRDETQGCCSGYLARSCSG